MFQILFDFLMIKIWLQRSFPNSKTHSNVLGNLKECQTITVNLSLNLSYVVSGLFALRSLIFRCSQRQSQNLSLPTVAAPLLKLAMFKAFSKFLIYISFMLVSLHS